MRLNPIAAKRAAVKASRIQRSAAGEIPSGRTRDPKIAPTPAKGSAKSVCGSLTKLA
jgi:hypothetical protein